MINKNSQKGFGLISLIIVIAVIAIGWWYFNNNPDALDKIKDIENPIEQAEQTRDALNSRTQDIVDEYGLDE